MAEDGLPRWDVINETIRALDYILVQISNQLSTQKLYPLSMDEVEVVLNQLQKVINKARVKDWASELHDEIPSPQMSEKPKGPLYG